MTVVLQIDCNESNEYALYLCLVQKDDQFFAFARRSKLYFQIHH